MDRKDLNTKVACAAFAQHSYVFGYSRYLKKMDNADKELEISPESLYD
jgi:hypothetical protein